MAPVVKTNARSRAKTPSILVVDDEPTLIDLVGDVVGGSIDCKVLSAKNISEARKILASTPIELLVADVHLPDGDGMALLASLKAQQPQANAIIITGEPSVAGAIQAIREGAVDFLPKPFSADQLVSRVSSALQRQAAVAKKERRLDKLRDAVKRLNEARRLVSKKVDLLCNDLITAYGDLSKQLDTVRTQESFRALLAEAKDLEQMLCHAMDWLLKHLGYSNVAIWLAGDDGEYQLGAYMKYTTPGEPQFTEALKEGVLKLLTRESFVHLSAEEAREKISPAEVPFIADQTILGVTCAYLGEPLAAIMLFRDGKTAFTDDDVEALKQISSIFATSLAGTVHEPGDDDGDDDGGSLLDDDNDSKPRGSGGKGKSDADWWKRGEAPPF